MRQHDELRAFLKAFQTPLPQTLIGIHKLHSCIHWPFPRFYNDCLRHLKFKGTRDEFIAHLIDRGLIVATQRDMF